MRRAMPFIVVAGIVAALMGATLWTTVRYGPPGIVEGWSGSMLAVALVTVLFVLLRRLRRHAASAATASLAAAFVAVGFVWIMPGVISVIIDEFTELDVVVPWIAVFAGDIAVAIGAVLLGHRLLRRGEV